jgi:hypothetical protein
MKKFQLYKEITLCSSPLLSVEATGLRKIVASLEEKINAEITLSMQHKGHAMGKGQPHMVSLAHVRRWSSRVQRPREAGDGSLPRRGRTEEEREALHSSPLDNQAPRK